MIPVEGGDRRCRQAPAYTGAGTDTATPGFVAVRNGSIEGEGPHIDEPGTRRIRRPIGVEPSPAAHVPRGIMLLDQTLGRRRHVAGQGNPVEMADGQMPAGFEQAPHLGRCPWPVEPVPALPGDNRIERPAGKARCFGTGAHWFVSDRTAISTEVRWQHISNMNIETPNDGINDVLFLLGVSYFLR